MILPSKHISLSESLLGLAGILLTFWQKTLYIGRTMAGVFKG